jgi:hypothetical protein
MDLSEAVRVVRARYIAEGVAASYYQINNGCCDMFAADVIEMMGGYAATHGEYASESFMAGLNGDPSENDVWDWDLLEKNWSICPPEGMTRQQMDAIDFGGHVWLSDGALHYDAECSEGVSSFFDLPLYRRYIVQNLRERGIPVADVKTDDVVLAPKCPVANPAATSKSSSPAM